MGQHVRWGILGAGTIAEALAVGIEQSDVATLTAVGSRDQHKAEQFIAKRKGDDIQAFGRYEDLIASDAVDAIYIATPHPMHAKWAILAAEAGKHVMVEKPAGLNRAQAMAMVEAAEAAGVFFMEAFKDRCHPLAHKLVELLKSDAIGTPRMMRASFGFRGPEDPASRLQDPHLGGGGILDVGCYAVELCRLVAGVVIDEPFDTPTRVYGGGRLSDAGIDQHAAATLSFASGFVAQVSTAVRVSLDNTAEIYGDEGRITLPDPWMNDREHAAAGRILVHRGGETVTHEAPAEMSAFAYEVDVASRAILAGQTQADPPAMTPADTLSNMHALDLWRKSVGVTYPAETPQGFTAPLRGDATRLDPSPMTYGHIKGLDKPVSRFVMGCDNQSNFSHAAVMFDEWFRVGGNTFDTSHIYGGGRPEKLLGEWIKSRGVRDQVVIISKGVHTPANFPKFLRPHMSESMERMQTDSVDLYICHRDNPDVPVGEWIDALNELRDLGWFKVAGGSNWSIERIAEANAYAADKGVEGMGVLSNNFSLARMIKPVWAGCIAASDPASREFLEANDMPNFAWSSQARGYFLPQGLRMRLGQDNFESWDSPKNQQRRERAEQLAKTRSVSPINIAAAYVLNQSFPSFALIGPRELPELRTSLPALSITLTPQELAWLDLRADTPESVQPG